MAFRRDGMTAVFVKMETAPLNLSVVANALCSNDYINLQCRCNPNNGGGWAWGSSTLERLQPELTYKPMFPHVEQLVVFPATFLFDKAAREPVKWVTEQLNRLEVELDQ